jgi:hypothetical protein
MSRSAHAGGLSAYSAWLDDVVVTMIASLVMDVYNLGIYFLSDRKTYDGSQRPS